MQKILFPILISIALVAGCAKSPLDKLKADVLYPDLTPEFWGKIEKDNPPLWKAALKYCDEKSEKVNCATINQIQIIGAGSKEIPKYGSSKTTLTIPNF